MNPQNQLEQPQYLQTHTISRPSFFSTTHKAMSTPSTPQTPLTPTGVDLYQYKIPEDVDSSQCLNLANQLFEYIKATHCNPIRTEIFTIVRNHLGVEVKTRKIKVSKALVEKQEALTKMILVDEAVGYVKRGMRLISMIPQEGLETISLYALLKVFDLRNEHKGEWEKEFGEPMEEAMDTIKGMAEKLSTLRSLVHHARHGRPASV